MESRSQAEFVSQNVEELFFVKNSLAINSLFNALDLTENWDGSLSSAVELTQPWVKGDHFTPQHRALLSDEQAVVARDAYEKMGLVEKVTLPAGKYDQVVVLGALQHGNIQRLKFLKNSIGSGVEIGEQGIVLWGGQRRRQENESEAVKSNLSQLLALSMQSDDEWFGVQQKLNKLPANESELLRASALQVLGNMRLKQLHLRLESAEPIQSYSFDVTGINLTLLHSLAVNRPNGDSRHTTESCAMDWLRQTPPVKEAKVAFITGNPYLERTARVVRNVLRSAGRTDIELIACGPAAYDNAQDHLFMGEIARNLYEDSKAIQ